MTKRKPNIKCSGCGAEKYVRPCEIKERKIRDAYRCDACRLEFRANEASVTKTCSNCGDSFSRIGGEFTKNSKKVGVKSTRVFCNHSCAAKYNNKHKKTGTRRSKLEKFLEEEIGKRYPEQFLYNTVSSIGYELDIYSEKLGLAIEINGIFHYQPIFGIEKLNRIREIDAEKIIKCNKAKISLHQVAVLEGYMKPAVKQKYLDIIVEIIENHKKNKLAL